MRRRIFKFFKDIFLETPLSEDSSLKFLGADLTDEYHEQIENLYLSKVLVAYEYDDHFRGRHHAFKYHQNQRDLKEFSEALWQTLEQNPLPTSEKIFITYVPIHWRKQLKRGSNHSYRLAKKLAQITGYPLVSTLRKTRHTHKQAGLSQEEREMNLVGSFDAEFLSPGSGQAWETEPGLKNITLILVDDVVSTGTTANMCAELLKKSGVKKVVGLFLARGK